MPARVQAKLPRLTLAVALAVLAPAAGVAIGACSGNGSVGSPPDAADVSWLEPDASEAAPPDVWIAEAQVDSTPEADASGPDATDAGTAADALDATATADSGEAGDAEAGPPELADAFAGDCGVGAVGEPTDLSCAGLYSDWSSKNVDPNLVEYDPGLHLWSDGAIKTRWVYLPAGQRIDTSDMDEWTLPVGTKLFKEFKLGPADGGTATRVETRMLWKRAAGSWYRTTYRWSADGQTSATEDIDGTLDAGGGYEIPSQPECDTCHNGRRDGVLGFEAVSLASPGASGVTIQTLVAGGWLTTPPSGSLAIPGDAIQSAALGYLHANCGTACHNSGSGGARNTGFFMRLDVATLSSVQATNAWQTGWNVPTLEYMIPSVATSYRLHACDTTTSCVYYRASHRAGLNGTPAGVQMPPLDTHRTDDAGMAAISAWIDEGCADGGM